MKPLANEACLDHVPLTSNMGCRICHRGWRNWGSFRRRVGCFHRCTRWFATAATTAATYYRISTAAFRDTAANTAASGTALRGAACCGATAAGRLWATAAGISGRRTTTIWGCVAAGFPAREKQVQQIEPALHLATNPIWFAASRGATAGWIRNAARRIRNAARRIRNTATGISNDATATIRGRITAYRFAAEECVQKTRTAATESLDRTPNRLAGGTTGAWIGCGTSTTGITGRGTTAARIDCLAARLFTTRLCWSRTATPNAEHPVE
ncbi:MAG: hypothetical protein JW829_02520 [Pirellulales bacterium]|nr:hypothetical protein [Pirellulales bacterium]